jgi:hypothetical protein
MQSITWTQILLIFATSIAITLLVFVVVVIRDRD